MSGPSDWITPRAAAVEYGVPIEAIALHMQCGKLSVRSTCGLLLVSRAEVAALALAMKYGDMGEDE